MITDEYPRRMLKKAVQQGRSKRRGESYSVPYVEPLSVARTPLADFVNSLLIDRNTGSQPLDYRLIFAFGQPMHPEAQPARQLRLIGNLQDLFQQRMTSLR